MNKKRKNVIEINGNLYDATTGLPIESTTSENNSAKSKTHSVAKKKGTSVDGFIGKPKPGQHAAKKVQPKKVTTSSKATGQTATASPKTTTVHHQPASKVGRKAKSSTTLNRSGVKKPVLKTAQTTDNASPSVYSSASKQVDAKRLERLQHIHRSSLVSRFGSGATTTQATSELAEELTAPTSQAATLTHHLTSTHDTPTPKLSKKEQFVQNTLAKTAIHESNKKAAHTATKKHKAKKAKSAKSRIGSYATAGMVALLVAGYVAYLNIPSISMKVAANRAGFAATMPSYKPSGYSLSGPIAYSPGQVTVNFSSNTDDRKFSLRQQPTTWDSNALLENYVTKQSSTYLTYQDQGLSIYIFDGTSAAWVNGQKMYVIEGDNSQLDTDQILKLATSV